MSKLSSIPNALSIIGNELISIVQDEENRTITPAQLLENINIMLATKATAIVQVPNVLISASGWAFSEGLYEYEIEDIRILPTSIVIVVPSNLMLNVVRAANIYPQTTSSDGVLKLFAKNHPTSDFYVTLNII
ncbi:MAG: hypothetical protein WCM93_12730 [Bacteroidota bacterium]